MPWLVASSGLIHFELWPILSPASRPRALSGALNQPCLSRQRWSPEVGDVAVTLKAANEAGPAPALPVMRTKEGINGGRPIRNRRSY
jgi:hypothetical protein